MDKPKLSIIIPVYNSENYLTETLESIRKSSFRDWEIILVNDGSKDNSLKICKEFENKDSRIKVINKNNTGVSDTRNIGMENAKGKYISFIDSDDLIMKNMFEKMVSKIEKDESEIVICGYMRRELKNNSAKDISIRTKSEKDLMLLSEFGKFFIENGMLINSPCNKIYIKEIIEKNNLKFPKIKTGEDLVFNLEYFKKCKNISVLNEELYVYIDRGSGITSQYIPNSFDGILVIYDAIKNFMVENNFYEQNKNYYNKIALDTIFYSFMNVFHKKSELKTIQMKKKYIKRILKDDFSQNFLNEKIEEGKIAKLTQKLIKWDSTYIIIILFIGTQLLFPIVRTMKKIKNLKYGISKGKE